MEKGLNNIIASQSQAIQTNGLFLAVSHWFLAQNYASKHTRETYNRTDCAQARKTTLPKTTLKKQSEKEGEKLSHSN